VNLANIAGDTALYESISHNHYPVVQYLLQIKGIDILHENENGCNALHLAARGGNVEIITAVLAMAGTDAGYYNNVVSKPLYITVVNTVI